MNEVLKEVDLVGGGSRFHVGRFSGIGGGPRRRSGIERGGQMGCWRASGMGSDAVDTAGVRYVLRSM